MRRTIFVGCIAILVVIGGIVFGLRWTQRGPGRASVGKAIDRFRTSSTVPAVADTLQPKAGVYVYKGSGSEHLSFLDTSQRQGPTEPGTVTALPNGCWSFQIDYNTFHSQRWIRCPAGRRLLERGGSTDQKFDFVAFQQSERGTTTCDPPFVLADLSAAPGTTWPVHCTVHSSAAGTNAVQSGTITFVGREQVEVGGVSVAALHAHQEMRLTGDQTGTVRVDLWLATADALPLRDQHAISVVSPAPAPLGRVTYTELGSWQLTALEPRQ